MKAQTTTDSLRTGSWLTGERVTGYLRLLAAMNLLGLALAICRAHGWGLPPEPHVATEFLSFYAAGRLVDAGRAAAVYAPGLAAAAFIPSLHVPPLHQAMERALIHDPGAPYLAFFYPPVFWLVCAPLARLPMLAAYLLWDAATGALLALALRRLRGGWGRIWPALAYLAVIENAAVGENAFLSAGLIAFGVMALESRPMLAGLCFGGLCYKPHFLLPALLFLAFGRRWRALAACIGGGGALCLASALLFGWQPWVTYFAVTVPHAEYMFAHAGIAYDLQVTPASALRLLGAGAAAAKLIEAMAFAFGAYTLFATRLGPCNLRAAALAASFPMLCGVMLDYDLTICGLAIPFLLRETARTGFLPWEKTGLAALFGLPLAVELLRTQLHIPLDPLIPAGFLLLLLRRARFGPSSARPRTPPQPA